MCSCQCSLALHHTGFKLALILPTMVGGISASTIKAARFERSAIMVAIFKGQRAWTAEFAFEYLTIIGDGRFVEGIMGAMGCRRAQREPSRRDDQ